MKKLVALVLCLTISGFFGVTFAAKGASSDVYNAIMKYKNKNYTGCIQDMDEILKKRPKEELATYYKALSYTQIGMKEEAKKFYQEVVDTVDEKILVEYSQLALTCLDNPQAEGCKNGMAGEEPDDDMSLFIKSGDFLHPELKKTIQQRELNDIKDNFNNGKVPDLNDYRFINDASGEVPTDAEIAAAVKVLAKVGFNPLNQAAFSNPQMALVNANTNNNSLVNMLPYLMAQKSGKTNMSPELIQAMLMNQATGGFDFSSNN